MLKSRDEDLKLYDEILQAIVVHGQDNEKILKTVKFRYNKEGTELVNSTFEWHWKKDKKNKSK